jgi:hypothetical protein
MPRREPTGLSGLPDRDALQCRAVACCILGNCAPRSPEVGASEIGAWQPRDRDASDGVESDSCAVLDHRDSAVQRAKPQLTETDHHGRRRRDEGCKAKWLHMPMLAAPPDNA